MATDKIIALCNRLFLLIILETCKDYFLVFILFLKPFKLWLEALGDIRET